MLAGRYYRNRYTEYCITLERKVLADSNEVKSPVRITPAFFFLLLTLVDGERHGYAMAQEVRERSDGAVRLGPGSLYWSLNRLAEVGLIEEVPGSFSADPGEGRRR